MAALPVPYRTSETEPSFQSLCDTHWHYAEGSRPFPIALDPFTCNRFEIAEFGREALALDIRYLGVCCGAGPHHIRALAEAVGKHPPASRYSADMSKHAFLGSHERIKKVQKDYARQALERSDADLPARSARCGMSGIDRGSSRPRCRRGSAARSTSPVGASSVPAAMDDRSRAPCESQNRLAAAFGAEPAARDRRRRVPLEAARLR